MQSLIKTRHDNDMIDNIGMVYSEIETELSWPFGLGVECNENHIGQRPERFYKCNLRQKLYWIVGTYWTGCNLYENKIKQWCNQSYKCSLHQKGKWIVLIDRTYCNQWWKLDRSTTWPIVWVWSMSNTILNYWDLMDPHPIHQTGATRF